MADNDSSETETVEAAAPKADGKAKPAMTKFEAVKRAMAKLGTDAKPPAIQAHLKKHYDVDISTDVAKNYKKKLVKEAREAAAAGPTAEEEPIPAPAAELAVARLAAVEAAKANDDVFGLPDIQAARKLIGRIGAERLKELIEVLAK